ncbi:ATP-binding cassette domain-containing protein [Rhodococcus triatomae]|uniref:ABC-2 type transport system ATP-binding protein n=1 Tax=Rhodococcus triatomae TaxID=300028 RepID=A0A1G8DZQ2_9NOCA|nr:ATP-binding cassette domain-containing protein [Rhodococcus triatomae]QNG18308.1 ATP-binding cassette domain-containing protein [Rhodococcus triatomae]QNG22022.1 ATP-binding cassette domain-containing protein [Rhodococcus triatomae]SDH63123.1 ABC-2 type transport system ATP-binding protein [Rhodococcus triatomae]
MPPIPPRDAAVSVTGLRKSFGTHTVLDGIDLEIAPGTVFSLLGPNGAGKTTTVQILSTLLPADSGTVRVAGFDPGSQPRDVRRRIAVTGQFAAVDNMLTGRENLRLTAGLQRLRGPAARRRVTDLLTRFGLDGAADRQASTYSGGMRRRLDIAMSLVGEPSVLFLDEPTTGLDPRSRRDVWELVRELVDTGVTVFLTTQYLEEAEQLADRIAVIHGGRIAAEGTRKELERLVPGGHLELRLYDDADLDRALRALHPLTVRDDRSALTVSVPTDGSVAQVKNVLDLLDADAVGVESMALHTPDLEDVFFALTGDGPPSREADVDPRASDERKAALS